VRSQRSPSVFGDLRRLNTLNRERSPRLLPIVDAMGRLNGIELRIAEDREALDDLELDPLAREEIQQPSPPVQGLFWVQSGLSRPLVPDHGYWARPPGQLDSFCVLQFLQIAVDYSDAEPWILGAVSRVCPRLRKRRRRAVDGRPRSEWELERRIRGFHADGRRGRSPGERRRCCGRGRERRSRRQRDDHRREQRGRVDERRHRW
jgi:hypothetical protein